MKILAIGNSFSQDGLAYLYQILESLGEKEIHIRNMVIGGCTLARHLECAENDLPLYQSEENTAGEWRSECEQKLLPYLADEAWDFVSLQQQSGRSGLPEAYGALDGLVAFVKKHVDKNAKFVWQATWAYPDGSACAEFANYGKNHRTMYRSIANTVREKIVKNPAFDRIVPSGAVVENLYGKYGEKLYRDGLHLSLELGRYAAGLAWAKTLTGKSLEGLSFAPPALTDREKQDAIAAAEKAVLRPFGLTE